MHSLDVPWPSPDAFDTCPRGSRLLEGFLGNDLIALPRPRHRAQFLQCVDRELESASIDWAEGRVHYDGTATTVESFPVSVDVDAVTRSVAERGADVGRAFRETHGIDADTTVAVGSDRLDYTAGVLERLDALETLFESRPDLRGALTYVQLARETGDTVPACQRVREDVEARIRTLDERFGTGEWSPVVPAPAAASDDGVLLLGPAAGAAEELSDRAVEFDPYDTSSAVEAFERALEMSPEERQTRMRAMRRDLSATDSDPWPAVLGAADAVRSGRRQAR
jgi:trehalose 6-phosphate synthase